MQRMHNSTKRERGGGERTQRGSGRKQSAKNNSAVARVENCFLTEHRQLVNIPAPHYSRNVSTLWRGVSQSAVYLATRSRASHRYIKEHRASRIATATRQFVRARSALYTFLFVVGVRPVPREKRFMNTDLQSVELSRDVELLLTQKRHFGTRDMRFL